jgi:peptidoglycan biosynthesis protein MviN/MurJ (putative lipid II flippase)
MTRREVAFLLTGAATGLMLAAWGIMEVLASLQHGAVVTAYSWSKAILIVPFSVLLIAVVLLLYPRRSKD